MSSAYYLFLIAPILAFYFLLLFFEKVLPKKLDLSLPIAFASGFIFLACSAIGARGGFQKRVLGFQHAWAFSDGKSFYASLTSNPVHNLIRMKKGASIPESFIKSSKKITFNTENSKHFPLVKKPKNVLFIFIESLSSYSIKNNHSPTLNNWLQTNSLDLFTTNSFYANAVFSKEALITTLFGVPSYFDLNFFESKYSNTKINGLGKVAKNNGLETFFLHAAPYGTQFFDAISKSAGIKNYISFDEDKPSSPKQKAPWGIHDELLFEKSRSYISNLKHKSFIGVIFTVSSHYPFKNTPNNPNGTGSVDEDYKLSIEYAGASFVKFVEDIKNEPWFSDTLLVVLGDHTPPISSDWAKQEDNVSKVPLILYQKDSKLSKLPFRQIGSQVDLPETVFDLLDLEVDKWPPFGSSLLSKDKEYSFITKGHNTYIMNEYKTHKVPTRELFNAESISETEIHRSLLDYVYRLENNSLYEQ